jgi:drug/metabolite transporter, DME family
MLDALRAPRVASLRHTTMTKPHVARPWLGVLAILAAAALWSLNGPLIKELGKLGVPGITIASYRSLIGGIVFLPLALRRRKTLQNVKPAWPIASVVTFTVMTSTFVIANTMTAAANAIILQYTSPIWVFLLSPLLLKERPGRAEGAVLLVAMLGVAVIFSGNTDTDATGLLIALASGVGYGALTVILRGLRPVSPIVVATLNALGSGLLLLVPVLLTGGFRLTWPAWWLLLFMGMVQFTFPYLLFSWGLQHVEAHRAALITLLETILNPLWTFLLIGERPPLATLHGGPLILAGVIGWLLLAWRRERRRTTASRSRAPTP